METTADNRSAGIAAGADHETEMKILFLEDDENRIAKARQRLIGHNVVFAKTAKEAIDALGKHQFTIASLDHDLGGEQMVASNELSGYAVAEFIAEMDPESRPLVCIVHSYNPTGADRMMACLRGCTQVVAIRELFGHQNYWRIFESDFGER
jgi:CheY-like chemotaxis protein